MNFFSHVAIASLYSEEAGVALGSMLPDLANLLGSKVPRSKDQHLFCGLELHVATDRAFHEGDPFRSTCAVESKELVRLGLSRGPAMAAAHVGLELLLDDALAEDEPSQMLFRRALSAAMGRAHAAELQWGSEELKTRFDSLCKRLLDLPMPRPPITAAVLVERVTWTLSPRPRLAVRADDRARLLCWADALASRCNAILPAIVDAVVRKLAETHGQGHPRFARPLRFRRAQSDEL